MVRGMIVFGGFYCETRNMSESPGAETSSVAAVWLRMCTYGEIRGNSVGSNYQNMFRKRADGWENVAGNNSQCLEEVLHVFEFPRFWQPRKVMMIS